MSLTIRYVFFSDVTSLIGFLKKESWLKYNCRGGEWRWIVVMEMDISRIFGEKLRHPPPCAVCYRKVCRFWFISIDCAQNYNCSLGEQKVLRSWRRNWKWLHLRRSSAKSKSAWTNDKLSIIGYANNGVLRF